MDIAQLKKDQDSRAKVEEEQKENLFALVSPIPTLTGDLATEMEQKKTILNFTLQPMKTQVTGLYASVKELNRDRLVDYLIPNAAHLPAAAISEKILNDFRDKIVKKDLDTWLLSFANERKEIFKSRLREVIFEGMEIKANPREMGVDEQYDLLFSQVAKSSQDLITKEQLAESFKRLGLNKSSIEVDQVFRSFKKATSENLTRDDFKRLMKHEYSSDMMKERLIKERLVQIINITDGFRQGYLSPAQITFIFERAGTKATQLEVEEFFKYCDVNEHKEIIVPSFINLVVYGPKEFNSTQDFLASGLVKLRSALQTNVVEQFKTLEHMPQHFIISFSEEEYLASPSRLPTGVLKPVLSDSKTYYSNLLPPVQAQEMNSYSRYKKYIKLNRHCHTYEIKLEKATGVPIPDNTIVSYNEIVGREIRIGIFDIKKNSFVGNIQNLECMWKFGYEDRLYFDKYNIEKEDIVIVRIPEFKPFEEYEEIEIQEVVKLPINPADSSQATNPPVVPPPGPMNVADPNNPNQPAHSLLQPVTNIVNSTLVDPSNPGTSQAINPVVAPQGPTPGLNPEGTQQIPPGQLPPGQPLQIPPGQLPPSPADQNQQPSNLPQPQPQPPAEPSFPGIPIIRRVKKPVQPPIYSLIFEIVYFVRKREVNSTVALSAGFGSLPLDSIEHETVQKVNLIGGGPYKDKMLQIYDGDVRTKRRGIIPSLSSLFEGKIKSILHVRTTRLRINSQIPTDFGEEIELLPDLGVFHYPQISVDSLLRQNMGRDAFPHYTAPALGVGLTLSTETYINAFCNIFCVPEFASMIVTFWSRLSKVLTDKNQSYESKLDAFKYLLNRLYALINATTFRMEKGAPQVSYYGEPEIQGIRRGLLLSELDNTFQFVNETLLNGKSKPVLEAKTLVRHGEAFIDPPEEVKHIGFSIDELLEDDGLM